MPLSQSHTHASKWETSGSENIVEVNKPGSLLLDRAGQEGVLLLPHHSRSRKPKHWKRRRLNQGCRSQAQNQEGLA